MEFLLYSIDNLIATVAASVVAVVIFQARVEQMRGRDISFLQDGR